MRPLSRQNHVPFRSSSVERLYGCRNLHLRIRLLRRVTGSTFRPKPRPREAKGAPKSSGSKNTETKMLKQAQHCLCLSPFTNLLKQTAPENSARIKLDVPNWNYQLPSKVKRTSSTSASYFLWLLLPQPHISPYLSGTSVLVMREPWIMCKRAVTLPAWYHLTRYHRFDNQLHKMGLADVPKWGLVYSTSVNW